ncbi:helix-turn-helix domain-containing protein [Longimicrobium sp.]|uniref:helix-turn-helix transcriptional regulator n=1 Tax=Longimicrobium sp. TaxID=2029185 RepID=UPI003B3A057F
MADVLVLSCSPAAFDRLRGAIRMTAAGGVPHALRTAAGWAELFELAARTPAGLAFVDPYVGGRLAEPEIRCLRERHPRLEVVAYADFTGRAANDPFTLALLGVRAVVSLGAGDEPAALAASLDQHLNAGVLDGVLARIAQGAPPHVRPWLSRALRSPTTPATAAELASLARCSPRTLRRTLRAAGLPPAEQLLAWRRLLHAAALLEDPRRSVESVARSLAFSSPSALRRSLRTLTGLRRAELVAGGGVRLLAELLLARCGRPATE